MPQKPERRCVVRSTSVSEENAEALDEQPTKEGANNYSQLISNQQLEENLTQSIDM